MNTKQITSSHLRILLLLLLVTTLARAQVTTFLHDFTNPSNSYAGPSGALVLANGNIYGVTADGGSYGYGTLFKLEPSGNFTVLHNFGSPGDGRGPQGAALVMDTMGNLYGTTSDGGSNNSGIVFKLGSSGNYNILHNFDTDNSYPAGPLVRDTLGNLYGTTLWGGLGFGTLFKLDPYGNYTQLHSFLKYPAQGLVLDTLGNLYGSSF